MAFSWSLPPQREFDESTEGGILTYLKAIFTGWKKKIAAIAQLMKDKEPILAGGIGKRGQQKPPWAFLALVTHFFHPFCPLPQTKRSRTLLSPFNKPPMTRSTRPHQKCLNFDVGDMISAPAAIFFLSPPLPVGTKRPLNSESWLIVERVQCGQKKVSDGNDMKELSGKRLHRTFLWLAHCVLYRVGGSWHQLS